MEGAGFEQLEKRLHVSVPPILRGDGGFGEFDEPIEPAAILDPESSVVWGGMMLPDALPVLGNGCGDVILARFGSDGSVVELVEWRHVGCLWPPTDVVPGFEAPVAALERDAEDALASGLERYCHENGGEGLANSVGVPWSTMAAWLADTDKIDETSRARIRMATSLTGGELFSQHWDRAEAAASAASTRRADLAWPGAVLGRLAERRGDGQGAAEWYRRSLEGLQTTPSLTALWDEPGVPFVVSRLRALGTVAPAATHLAACLGGDSTVVRAHWIEAGDLRLRDGRALEAYGCYMRAGWDWHFTNDMAVVLERLTGAADAAGSRAWTALARLHLQSLLALS